MMSQQHCPYLPLFKAFVDRQIAVQIARKQTRDTNLSWEDAAQVAYAKLWQATQAGAFRHGDTDDYCRWAARVCCFAILDHLQHSHQRQHDSLDQPIPGTDLFLIETLADEFDALDAIDRADRLLKILTLIADLDRSESQPLYVPIWQAMLSGQEQNQIAQMLGRKPYEICRCWRKIRHHVAKTYPDDSVPLGKFSDRQDCRNRSNDRW